MTDQLTEARPFGDSRFPLMNEDSDWFAFHPSFSKVQVFRELVWNYADWLCDDLTRFDEDDNEVIDREACRSIWNQITKGALRPSRPGEYGFEDDWWYEAEENKGEPAWIVKL